MNEDEKAQTVELIGCVQLDGGSGENLKTLEQDPISEADAKREETHRRNRLELYGWFLNH